MLSADNFGFLTGESVTDIKRSADLLGDIKKDLAAIKQVIVASPSGNKSKSSNVVSFANVVRPTRTQKPKTNLGNTYEKSKSVAIPASRARGADGRFTSNGDDEAADDEKADDSALSLGLNSLGNKLADTITASGQGLEDVDPTIKAFQEVATPAARGYQLLSGGSGGKDKSQNRWYRKIFKLLKLGKKDDTVYQKATRKSLKEIEDKSTGGGDGIGVGESVVGSTLARMAKSVGPAIAGIGPILLGGVTTALGIIFSPIGLAIGAAAALAWGLFTEDGRKFFGDIASSISDKWDSAVDWFIDKFPDFSNLLGDGVGTVNKGFDAVKGWFGVKNDKPKEPAPIKTSSGNFDPIKAAVGFKGGGINGLTDAQSRALAAETQRTESNGDQRAENKYGYIGKYQFGAGALADSGLVDQKRLKAAKKTSGKGWYKGGQTDFLNNTENWKVKGGKEAYLGDSALQDKAFATYTNKHISSGIRTGGLSKNSNAETIGAYAKASHLKGVGGANKLFKEGIVGTDANGTSTAKYAADGAAAITNLAPMVTQRLNAKGVQGVTATASVPLPKIPTLAKSQPISEAPPVVTNFGGGSERKSLSVTVAKGEVTQDVGNRKIAHIVTGGMSSC